MHARTFAGVGGAAFVAAGIVIGCVGTDVPTTPAPDAGATDAGNPGPDAALADSGAPDGGKAPFLYVFVTANTHIGQFPPPEGGPSPNGYRGADAFCKDSAEGGDPVLRGRKWVAWLTAGTGAEAWRRLPRAATGERDLAFEYRLRDGQTVVFPKGFYLGGQPASDAGPGFPVPLHAIDLDESHPGSLRYTVWTGTEGAGLGAHPANCGGWNAGVLSANDVGLVGTTLTPPTVKWTHDGDVGALACTIPQSLYCFEVP